MESASPRVYLHIGLPKSGTTYLQDLLWSCRDTIADAGLLYPGRTDGAHFEAAVDLQPDRYWTWIRPDILGAWDRLVAEIRAWPGTAIVSHELFATATPKQAFHALSALDPAEVHIVCTARDLARQIPSSWQENVKNAQAMSYPDFLAALRTGEPEWISEQFWGFQDLTRVLETWCRTLPPSRVHVVTVPPEGADGGLLWRRFASVLGIDATRLQKRNPAANRSLPLAETEVLRRINLALGDDIRWEQYASVVRERLADTVLAPRREGVRIGLPPGEHSWVRERAERFAADIEAAGYNVVGDLGELVPGAYAANSTEDLSDGDLLETAVAVIAELIRTDMPPPPPTIDPPAERGSLYRRIIAAVQDLGR